MASKEVLRKTTLAALQTWPKDPLRPAAQLRDVLTNRISTSSSQDQPLAQQSNAILSLLANRYSQRYPVDDALNSLAGGLMQPRSNPEYYRLLMKDLDQVPTRTWLQKAGLRMKGMFRWT